jgi:hypothetical protein
MFKGMSPDMIMEWLRNTSAQIASCQWVPSDKFDELICVAQVVDTIVK